jgi:hypothetical protein
MSSYRSSILKRARNSAPVVSRKNSLSRLGRWHEVRVSELYLPPGEGEGIEEADSAHLTPHLLAPSPSSGQASP